MMKDNKKVLMISSQEIISNLQDGGKLCSNRNYQLLLDIFGKENVFLIMFTSEVGNPNNSNVIRVKPFKNNTYRIISILGGNFFESRKCDGFVVDYIEQNDIDIVFIDRSLFGNLAYNIKRKTSAHIWVFSHNFERDYVYNKYARYPLVRNMLGHLAEVSEFKTIKTAEKLFVLTKRDQELNKNNYKKDSYIIPMSFEDTFDESEVIPEENANRDVKNLLFIGSMFGPNYAGVKWFVDNVMPDLRNYNLKIVGKGFETKKCELTRRNVEVVGTVDTLDAFYYSNNIMVMPIFYGSGQKVKTAEAMMYGKTILASDEALEGYDVDNVKDIYRCNSKIDYINALKKLEKKNIYYSNEVRNAFLKKYSKTAINYYARQMMQY